MRSTRALVSCGLLLLAPPLPAAETADPTDRDGVRVRATIELTDGTRLVGEPDDNLLRLGICYASLGIPLEQIGRLEVHPPTGGVVHFRNGDQLTGLVEQARFPIQTALGRLSPGIELIRSVQYSSWKDTDMPRGEGTVSFGGVNWLAWRTEFEVDGDVVRSLPRARPGFQYGHEGHGRGPALFTNIGASDWRDYSIEADFCVPGVDPAFNPYGLPADYHDGGMFFHVADAKESHNDRGGSYYALDLHGDGAWALRCAYNVHCAQPMGWGSPTNDGERTLASGGGLTLDRVRGNHLRVDVIGKRIRVWFDDRLLADVEDDAMDQLIGGQRLDHGGVGFGGGFDAMFWLKNFSARQLHDAAQHEPQPASVTPKG